MRISDLISDVCSSDRYVFALRDPRNDQVFHVGHGTGNQVFAPVFEALGELANLEGADGPAESNAAVTAAKIARIREIYDAGSAVEHYVLLRSVDRKSGVSGKSVLILGSLGGWL